MNENQSVRDRLKSYIKSLNISVRQFERDCGLCNAYVNSIRQGIQPDSLKKIVEKYPTLNVEWLLTGEGTMLRFDATASTEEEEIAKATDMYKAMMEELARMKKELEDKDKFIEKLNERIDMQDNVIKRLLSDSAITPSKCNG